MTKPIDWSKPVQTRDGRKVEIITTKGRNSRYPIIGYVGNEESIQTWTAKGQILAGSQKESGLDLVNVSEKKIHKFYVVVWRTDKDKNRVIHSATILDEAGRFESNLGDRIVKIIPMEVEYDVL